MAERRSDADHLLRLTAFEILLKALRLLHHLPASRSHDYTTIFGELPASVQQAVWARARERRGYAPGLYDHQAVLLTAYTRQFVALRYAYEEYATMTDGEMAAAERRWIADGAREGDAIFAFHSEELIGLVVALRDLVDEASGA